VKNALEKTQTHKEEEGKNWQIMSKHNKVVYEYLKSHNMCVTCGRKTNGEHVRCEVCYEKYNRKRLKPFREKVQENKTYCSKCEKNTVKYSGLCDKCYGEVVIPEYLRGNSNAEKRSLSRVH
jgi:predicted amidophosphoribosyltransferase